MAVVISVMLSLASGRCDIIYLPENPHDSEELRDSPDLRELPHVRRVDEGDADEVRQDGQQVNDVHRALHELELARRGDQSYLQRHFSLREQQYYTCGRGFDQHFQQVLQQYYSVIHPLVG